MEKEKSLVLPFDADEPALRVDKPDKETAEIYPKLETVPEGRVKGEWGESEVNKLVCPHHQENPVSHFALRWRSDMRSVEPDAIEENDYYCSSEDCREVMKKDDGSKYPVSIKTLDEPEFQDKNGKLNDSGLVAVSRLGHIIGVKNPTEQILRNLWSAKTLASFETIRKTNPEDTEPADGPWGDTGGRKKI